ncbi:MAG TPA: pseudouridine synthase [Geothermobacteraceae bacterium]|nr:pseudouridine synthase [Geothermobacteraceae bacterium]
MKQRLQKLIAQAGVASRRKAEEWIRRGEVTVNGQVASLGDSADPDLDRVEVQGQRLGSAEEKIYLLLNKPSGYVTSLNDPEGRSVVTDLLKNISVRVYPVGRLDLTTEGLLLLTNDGALAHQLMHPKHEIDKTYLVRVRGQLSREAIRQLEQGVLLEDGKTAPARVSQVRVVQGHSWFSLTIHEGRNRQVRRMCEAVGLPVSRLKRTGYAFLTLDRLPTGQYRFLSQAEVGRLKKI